eukprot:1151829-Pelagomonas_calceolata.AAC.2
MKEKRTPRAEAPCIPFTNYVERGHASIINSYVCANLASPPRAFAKSFENHSSSNIVAFSFQVGDDMIIMMLAARKHMECAV